MVGVMVGEWQHRPTLLEAVPRTRLGAPQSASRTLTKGLARTESNLPIRVPRMDWSAVVTGEKRMFRTYNGRGGKQFRQIPVIPLEVETPRLCLLYTQRPYREPRVEAEVAVLEACRQEPLGAISIEDLEMEGYEFLPAFRYYWRRRYPNIGWVPTELVTVLQVRPLREGDLTELASALVQSLFGEWLNGR